MGEWKEKDARAETIEAGNREEPTAGSPVGKMEEGAKVEAGRRIQGGTPSRKARMQAHGRDDGERSHDEDWQSSPRR